MDFNSIKLNDSQMRYVSPLCKLVNMAPRSNYLQPTSYYGPNGQAGGEFYGDNTNDYEDNLL